MSYWATLRLLRRDTWLYLITWAFNGFAYSGIYTVLFNLYLLRLGYGPEFIGLVNGFSYLSLAFFSLPAGTIGKLWGSRRTMILGLLLIAVGLGLPPLAEFIPPVWRAGWIVFTYLISFLAASLYFVNGVPFLMGATSPEERGHAFSVQAALNPLFAFAGNLVGGFLPGFFARVLNVSLDSPAPYRYPLLIAAGLYIPATLVMLATREVGSERKQKIVANRETIPLALIFFITLFGLLQSAGVVAARTFFNVYLDADLGVPTVQIGTLAASGQLLAVPAALAAPLLMRSWGKGRTIILGTLGLTLSLMLLGLIPHWGAAGLGFMGVIALLSIVSPAFSVYHQELVTPPWRATMSGAAIMALGLSGSAMSFGGGYLITALGYRSLFLLGAGLSAAGALLFWVYFRLPRGELARSSVIGIAE